MTRRSIVAVSLAWLAACASDEPEGPPTRDCRVIVWAAPSHAKASLEVVGSWDDWRAPGTAMLARDDGWRVLALDLPPGEHGYLVIEDGTARLDAHNPVTSFREDGREVSWVRVEDCGEPELAIGSDDVHVEAGALSVDAQFLAVDASPILGLDPASVRGDLELQASDVDAGTLRASSSSLGRGRHSLTLRAADEAGREAEATVSVFVDPIAATWNDAILYQIMIDRFYAADASGAIVPLEAPATPGSRAGGTLAGVEAALEAGYFEALGVSALWLSPVYQNPEEARLGTDGRLYEGYHGYWVTDSRRVDDRIGGEEALRSLIDAAHARGLAIILDVVPNHVYETHPIVAQGLAEGWFNEHPSECVCGTPSCPWSAFMQDCWFAPYLPDIRVENPAAMNFVVGELAWWLDNFAIDGLRVDAVPMMPRAASRRIVHEVRRASAPGRDRLVLGEVFTGPGPGGVAQLRYFLGPESLDSVFDFPTMWAVRELVTGGAGFTSLDALLGHIDAELHGSEAVLGRIVGNHDVARLVSAIVGDAGGDPWEQPAAQPTGASEAEQAALERVALAATLQMTLPGMPVIYYGDELALAGANDPDNRRVMPDVATLSPARRELLEHVRTLGRARRCSPALRSTRRETLHVTEDTYAYVRVAEGSGSGGGRAVAVVVMSRADAPRTISLPGSPLLPARARDVLNHSTLALDAGVELELGPRSSLVLLPEDDPCATP